MQLPHLLNSLHFYLLTAGVEGEAGHAAGHHTPAVVGSWEWLLETNLINIAIAVLLIGFLLKKLNVGSNIEASRQRIATDIESLEKQKQLAQQRLAELKKKTASLDQEVEAILTTARESADSLSGAILRDANLQAEKIIDAAKSRVELEQRAAAKDLERRLLNDALADAREDLTRSLTPADQRKSVEAFLDELSQNKGAGLL